MNRVYCDIYIKGKRKPLQNVPNYNELHGRNYFVLLAIKCLSKCDIMGYNATCKHTENAEMPQANLKLGSYGNHDQIAMH